MMSTFFRLVTVSMSVLGFTAFVFNGQILKQQIDSRLEGEWIAVSSFEINEHNPNLIDKDTHKDGRITFFKNSESVDDHGNWSNVITSKGPIFRRIDIEKRETQPHRNARGIYMIDGDILLINLHYGNSYPETFSLDGLSETLGSLIILKRVNKNKVQDIPEDKRE